MMRVASNQFRNQAVQTITEQQATIAKLQQQASTGQKVNRPRDDPLAAAEVERLRSDPRARWLRPRACWATASRRFSVRVI